MKNKNIIGIIGGMGPQASNELYRLIIEEARHHYGARNNDEYPEVVIDSVPVPDFLSDKNLMDEAKEMLEDRVRRLTSYGASILTMACNTACILIDDLHKQTDIPIVSVVDEVITKVSSAHKKLLLLASPTSLRFGLYQLALVRQGILYVVPHKRDYRELEYIIRGVIEGESREILMRKLTRIAERYILKENIDGIVLGCTELPLVFPIGYRLPVYNSLSILAEAVLKRYYRKEEL